MTYTEPLLSVLLLLGLVGVVRSWRRPEKRRRPWLETLALAGITLFSTEASAWVLTRPLEAWYSQQAMPQTDADAIVVLSGAVSPPRPARPYPLSGPDTYRRVKHAAWLFQNWKAVPILVAGGGQQGPPFAETMRALLLSERVPDEQIWMEPRSTDTHEAALLGAEMLRARSISRVALVVEASYMPRAALSFKKAGIAVVPVAVRHTGPPIAFSDYVPGWRGLAANDETVHEIVGLAWYKVRGWI